MSPILLRADDLTCRELVELVSDYLEESLSDDENTLFEAHIAGCDGCSTYVEQIRQTIRVAGRVTEDSIEPAARDALLEAFRGFKRG